MKLIDDQPVSRGDMLLLIDRARDAITGEVRLAKGRLAAARAS